MSKRNKTARNQSSLQYANLEKCSAKAKLEWALKKKKAKEKKRKRVKRYIGNKRSTRKTGDSPSRNYVAGR